MTGKQFKEFANQVPDNAVIEMQEDRYPREWEPLVPNIIRARLIISPQVEDAKSEEAEA